MRKFLQKALVWLPALLLLPTLSSCFDFEQISFKGIESFDMPTIDDKQILVNLLVRLDNPNTFKIKVKPSNLLVYIEETPVGTLYLDEKVVLKKREEGVYSAKLRMMLEKGAFFSLMRYATLPELKVRLQGKIKGSVYGLSKKIEIDQTKVISGEQLKNGFLKLPK